MKINKIGISLIVLVITIIIITILSTTAIISIVNNGVIDFTKSSVDAYTLKQVRDIASVAWNEALVDMNISTAEEYTNYILQFLRHSGYTEEELKKYTIIANENEVTVHLKDNIEPPTITLTLDKTIIEKEIGSGNNTEILTATLTNANGNLVWSTSDDTVVTVEGNDTIGTVTIVGAGTAIITVTYGDMQATCKINITEKEVDNLITFTIAGVEYQAEEGMTWRQWCENPSYNVGNKFSIGTCKVSNEGQGGDFIDVETVIDGENYVICNNSLQYIRPDELCGNCGQEELCEFDLLKFFTITNFADTTLKAEEPLMSYGWLNNYRINSSNVTKLDVANFATTNMIDTVEGDKVYVYGLDMTHTSSAYAIYLQNPPLNAAGNSIINNSRNTDHSAKYNSELGCYVFDGVNGYLRFCGVITNGAENVVINIQHDGVWL